MAANTTTVDEFRVAIVPGANAIHNVTNLPYGGHMGELEEALARTESDARAAADTAAKLLRLLKRAQNSAAVGDLTGC